jgi:hypothetical protein
LAQGAQRRGFAGARGSHEQIHGQSGHGDPLQRFDLVFA